MARYTGPVCRQCRREGGKLFLKGEKCFTEKCPVDKRTYAPGEHGQGRGRRTSEYGIQLREKQKARRIYGVLERQFRKYYENAAKAHGVTGDNLLIQLETRLDSVVYRFGIGPSRAATRQLVMHGHITVNGKKVDIPSYQVEVGDIISVREGSRNIPVVQESLEASESRAAPEWLEWDAENLTGKVISIPSRDQIDINVQEHLIIEHYSR